jgi:hypothetical protein
MEVLHVDGEPEVGGTSEDKKRDASPAPSAVSGGFRAGN